MYQSFFSPLQFIYVRISGCNGTKPDILWIPWQPGSIKAVFLVHPAWVFQIGLEKGKSVQSGFWMILHVSWASTTNTAKKHVIPGSSTCVKLLLEIWNSNNYRRLVEISPFPFCFAVSVSTNLSWLFFRRFVGVFRRFVGFFRRFKTNKKLKKQQNTKNARKQKKVPPAIISERAII